jgi:hypothetical protein
MNDLKKLLVALHERIRPGSIINRLLVGLLMSGPLSAQPSAGHTVSIRIIRPILFSITPAENRLQTDLRHAGNEITINWKSDLKPKKITVSIKGDDPGSKLDLILSSENHQKSKKRMRIDALDENLTAAISGSAGSLAMRYYSDSNSRGGAEPTKQHIYYTVMDI